MREVYLCKKLQNNTLQCTACSHYCVLKSGDLGKCGVRKNILGKLYLLVYGKIAAVNIEPIEKKSFFHFMPGTETFSIATVGCNFRCLNCQIWDIAQGPKTSGKIRGQEMTAEEIVKTAMRYGCPSISYAYEPTVYAEFAFEVMKLAKKRGIKNCWVSNGFMSKETIDLISPYLDTASISLKGASDKFYKEYCDGRLIPVMESIKELKKRRIRLEITTLAIPKITTEKVFTQIARFIKKEVGPETPWHILRFFPEISWGFNRLRTPPLKIVQSGCDIGLKEGLLYVYAGNVPGLASEDTYCPKCHKKMIDRTGYAVERKDKNGKCSNCGTELNIINE